jgi:hypothetical protein
MIEEASREARDKRGVKKSSNFSDAGPENIS